MASMGTMHVVPVHVRHTNCSTALSVLCALARTPHAPECVVYMVGMVLPCVCSTFTHEGGALPFVGVPASQAARVSVMSCVCDNSSPL